MNPVVYAIAAGTASGMVGVGSAFKSSCTAEGRICAAGTKLETIDARHKEFLNKALPELRKTHPRESICTNSKRTTKALNRYEPLNSCIQIPHFNITLSRLALRKSVLAGTVEKRPFWERLSPWFKSAEIGELERRLVEWDDTTLVCPLLDTP